MTAFELPAAFKKRASSERVHGQVWFASLPDLVVRLGHKWHFSDREVLAGGSEALALAGSIIG